MAFFVFVGMDKPGASALRAATREAHLAYLNAGGSIVKLAGAYLGEDGAPVGSMLVLEATDQAAAAAVTAADPYAQAGVFASTEIRPYRIAVGALA